MASSSSIKYPKLQEIKKLIRFVTDEEMSEFDCHVPPDKELDDEEFPTCEFDMPSDIKMKSEWGDWVLPLMTALEEDGDLDMSKALWKEYCKIPSPKKMEYRVRMCSIVRRERRENLYKKYMFAIGKNKGNQQPKKPLKYKYVKKAIRSVSDDDTMLGFECDIPTDDQLDQEGFPDVPDFSMPSDNDLCNEWSKWQPVFRDLLGDSFVEDQTSWANYMMFPQDDRANYRANMYAHMKRRNRRILYKKWMYVKWRKEKNKDERMVVAEVQVPKEEVVAHDISEVARVVADISEEEVKHDQEEYDHTDNHRTSVFDSEEMSKEEIENNLAGENKREGINNSASMGQRPTIFLFIQHDCPDMSHSLYMIQPPLDLSGYDQMIDSRGYMVDADSRHISPVATFQNNDQFLRNSASVNLGSKTYFFGGRHEQVEGSYSDRVQVFDTDHPEEGMRYVASMNAPKQSPCVFAADDMIYALGSPLDSEQKPTSLFERYIPSSNRWEVLPDPPPPLSLSKDTIHLDCATVLGRFVFIADLGAIFDLDTLTWDPSPPPKLASCFPYGSLFVNDSVYRLCGPGTRKPGTAYSLSFNFGDPVKVVKRGPVTTTKERDCVSSFLKSVHLASGKEQVMAAGLDLNEGIFFTENDYFPWIDLFHMGGRFFCYIVTAQLVRWDFSEYGEQKSRGVWIRFFEEVPVHTGNCNGKNCNCNETKFRQLASFCYKIVTNFRNPSSFIRCSVLGTVPDSWVNTPQKFKQEWKPKLRSPDNCKTRDDNLKTLLAVKEEENRRLVAELAKKNEILKAYEALLAKTGGMVDV